MNISYNSASKANQALVSAASKKSNFGSWKNAVIFAGIEYRDEREREHPDVIKSRIWSEEKILFEIKKLKDAGVPLNSNYIQKKYTPVFTAATRYFKSWGNAIEMLGINYNDIRLTKFWTEDGSPKEKIIHEIIKTSSESPINSAYIQVNNPSLRRAVGESIPKGIVERSVHYRTFMEDVVNYSTPSISACTQTDLPSHIPLSSLLLLKQDK